METRSTVNHGKTGVNPPGRVAERAGVAARGPGAGDLTRVREGAARMRVVLDVES